MTAIEIVVTCSAVVQACTGGVALAFAWSARPRWVWMTIPAAFFVLAAYQFTLLVKSAGLGETIDTNIERELVRFAVSVLLLIGAVGLRRYLATVRLIETERRQRGERFRDYAEMAADWFWEMGVDEKITYLSDRVTEVTGVPREYFIGKRREEFNATDVRGGDWQAYRRNIDARQPFREFVYRWESPTGRVHWISISGKPVFDAADAYLGYRGTAREITDIHLSEETRKQQGALLESIVQNIPSMISVKDAMDLRYVVFNKAGEEFMGRPRREIIGKRDVDLFDREQAEAIMESDRAVLDGAGPLDLPESSIDTRSGRRFFRSRKLALLGEDGEPRYIVVVSDDVTEWRRTQSELMESKNAAERASRAKSEFLAKMSHELRTPLNAILGFSEVMKDEMLGPISNDSYKSYSSDIHSSGTFLLQLIGDLLDLSKIEAGKLPLRKEIVDLREVLSGCVSDLAPRMEKAGQSCTGRMPEGSAVISGDVVRLRQVFNNILVNACKFTPAGGEIRVSIENDPRNGVKIDISDTGIGIAPAQMAHVFDPFYQADGHPMLKTEGTGLGLSITKSLVEMHDGAIAISSEPGRGTTVSITFPPNRHHGDQVEASVPGSICGTDYDL